MKTFLGDASIPSFKIVGTNHALQAFELECQQLGLQVSKRNEYFRDDYEHCLMPCYAYDKQQPHNSKLQTLAADVYTVRFTYDLATDHDLALAMVEIINSVMTTEPREQHPAAPQQQQVLTRIRQLVTLRPVRTSPPSLASEKILFQAASRPGMKVYFSLHDFCDSQVPPYLALTYPGRNFCDPDLAVLQEILTHLTAGTV